MKKIFAILSLCFAATAYSDNSAVIITGDTPKLESASYPKTWTTTKPGVKADFDEFWNDTYLMWEVLYKFKGWPDKSIYVIYGNGQDDENKYTDRYTARVQTNILNITDYPAYLADVQNMFTWLANGDASQNINKMTDRDFLFVYTFDHGYRDIETGLTYLNLMDKAISDVAFAEKFNAIPCWARAIWMQQCFSGGFIDNLANSKTAIHTAVSEFDVAWPVDDMSRNGSPLPEIEPFGLPGRDDYGVTHGEYSFHVMNAQRGGALYPYNAPPVVNADLDADGKISIYESWVYERDHYTDGSEPQYSDLGSIGSHLTLDYPFKTKVILQNNLMDYGVNNAGAIYFQGSEFNSPYFAYETTSTPIDINAKDEIFYNERNYFCSWSDGGYNQHIIQPEIPPIYTAFYKKQPYLYGKYGVEDYYLCWDWPSFPSPKIPPHFLRYELYRADVGKIWEGFKNQVVIKSSILKGVPTEPSYGMCAVFKIGTYEKRVWSNQFSFYSPVLDDPIVAYSTTSEATSYSNGKKLVIDNKGKLHVVIASNDTVYYTTSTDEGNTWSTQVAIGEGKNPAIELNSSQTPTVCWSKVNELYYSEHSSDVWSTPQLIYTGPAGSDVSYLSYVLDQKTNNSYLGWVDKGATASAVYIAPYNPSGAGQLVPTPIDQGGASSFKSPSLALDRTGNLKAAWSNNGRIYYFDEAGQTELGQNGIHPIVETYGDRTVVVWQEEITAGIYQIAKRYKGPLGWSEKQIISYPDNKNADFPAIASNNQYVYAKNNEGNDCDILWHAEYENGWVQYERNITSASGGVSKYPSVAFRQLWPKSKLYILWTEDTLKTKSNYAIIGTPVKIYAQEVESVPYFYADLGTEEAMVYTIQKAATFNYGQTPVLTVDYHPTQLKYSFTGLDPTRYYMLKAVFYHELSDRIQQKMKVDGQQFDVANLKPKEKAEFKRWLMPNLYSDGQIEITIDKQKGEYAVCAVLSIEEYEKDCDQTKDGGTQTTESKPVSTAPSYALMQNTPNPASQHTEISYQIAKQGQVSLKVYNTLGQVVKTLVNETQNPGPYNVKWDGMDEAGRQVTAGIYFYRLTSREFNSTKKMVILR